MHPEASTNTSESIMAAVHLVVRRLACAGRRMSIWAPSLLCRSVYVHRPAQVASPRGARAQAHPAQQGPCVCEMFEPGGVIARTSVR
mmetsp:Transcript_12120/g.25575  ORF Transcript_12120/g.25575 Transcript_12120/m.25575 type:complete len:87 (+) Transcript_12120:571-831(+)